MRPLSNLKENDMTDPELAERLKEVSLLKGAFTLRSGRQSHYIIDKYAFETRPELLAEIARRIAARIPDGITRIAGVELGGVPLATAVSLQTGIPFVIVKKEKKGYGTDKAIEGALAAGDRVVLVEDVATTGGGAIAAAQQLVAAGAKIVKVIGVVDREEGAGENFAQVGFPFEALFTRTSLGIA